MSHIRSAMHDASLENALYRICNALTLDAQTVGEIPTEAEWRAADEVTRLAWISRWLMCACQHETRRLTGTALHEPIGGSKYAHQND